MTDATPPAFAAEPLWGTSDGLTRVEADYRWVMTIRSAFFGLALLAAGGIVEYILSQETAAPPGTVMGPVALIVLCLLVLLPARRWHRLGYDISDDRLRVARGYLWRTDTIVPFGRIQHIDVDQGLLDRAFDLATLVVHTAGTHNSTVSLPGLSEVRAAEMRERIRAHITRETL
jgi:membrane protein YdbS with pleckstrin-like domain